MIWRRYRDAKWWLFHRLIPRHRYHVVHTGLEPSYYDVDTLMLHACMALLCRYVENEHGGAERLSEFVAELRAAPDTNAPETCEEQAARDDEALAIYRWWKVEKPADEELNERQLTALYGWPRDPDPFCTEEEFRALETKIDDDEQGMLHRLIDIRGSLWT